MKIIKNNKPYIIFILVLALFLRVIFLDRIPTGISNDEYYFLLNSKSVFYNFISLFQHGWNIQIFENIIKSINSETSILIMAPFMALFPSSLFFARLPYALVGVLTIFLIYKIARKCTKNNNLALLIALLASINPWSIYVNRTSFDAPVALLFFVLTIYLQTFANYKLIILSAFTSLLAFNGYIGTKVIYLPFMLSSAYYFWRYVHHQKFSKSFLFLVLFSIFVTGYFLVNLSKSSIGGRTSEIIIPSSTIVTSQVIDERNQSISSPLNVVFTNRYVIYLRIIFDKYLNNFSTDVFFLHGDPTYMISLWKMGYFYYIDAALFIFGLIYLFNRFPSLFYFLVFQVLLSPIPEAIRVDKIPAYAFHSSYQYPFLYIILGCGAYYLLLLLRKKYLRILFVIVYITLFINFLNIYFIKYPIYQSEGFFVSRRIVANYLKFEQEKSKQIFVITAEPEAIFRNYLYFTKQFNYKNFEKINTQYKLHPDKRYFEWENITISDQIPKTKIQDEVYIFDGDIHNFPFSSEQHHKVINLGNSQVLFKIYFSKTCKNIEISNKSNTISFDKLQLESLSEKEFCKNFVSHQ